MIFVPERGNIVPATMVASAIMGLLTTFGLFLVALTPETPATMEISPTAAVVTEGKYLTTTIEVTTLTPVNVFKGVINFDSEKMKVERIDYNTSIADLWTEKPWYENGDGTIAFAGGTTMPGGFVGTGTLLTITFLSLNPGTAKVTISDALILKHDGLGTETDLATPLEGIFTVVPEDATAPATKNSEIVVRDPKLTADLNTDGLVTISDLSVFFVYLTTNNLKGDLNNDQRISTADLSILISQM